MGEWISIHPPHEDVAATRTHPSRLTPLVLAVVVTSALLGGCRAPSPGGSASPTSTPDGASAAPASEITREAAIAAARAVSERWADGEVLDAHLARYGQVLNDFAETTPPIPTPGDPVWWISLGTDPGPLQGQGEYFIVDVADGHVVQHYEWIS